MNFMKLTRFWPFLVGTVLILAAHLLGVWADLGGHPYWSQSASVFGLGAGVLGAALVWRAPAWGVVTILVLLAALAFATSHFAKAEFVGSYAANGFAGRIWYYGFIGFIGAGFAGFVMFAATIRAWITANRS
mgnify:CR=1 FL=1|jgi:hypothetical protein